MFKLSTMATDVNEFQSNGHVKSSPRHSGMAKDGNVSSGSCVLNQDFSTSILFIPPNSSSPLVERPDAPTNKCTYPSSYGTYPSSSGRPTYPPSSGNQVEE